MSTININTDIYGVIFVLQIPSYKINNHETHMSLFLIMRLYFYNTQMYYEKGV